MTVVALPSSKQAITLGRMTLFSVEWLYFHYCNMCQITYFCSEKHVKWSFSVLYYLKMYIYMLTLSIYLSVHLWLYRFIHIPLYISIHLSQYLSNRLSICFPFGMSVCLSCRFSVRHPSTVFLSLHYIYLPIRRCYICPSVCNYICPSVYLYLLHPSAVYLSESFPLFLPYRHYLACCCLPEFMRYVTQ
jgi:hypothetical protein